MAKTTFATSNALTKKLYEEKLFRDTMKVSYFYKFFGPGTESIVQEATDLEKDKGDNITFGIRMRLSGAGVNSGEALEGNEESLTTHSFNLSLEEYAHAVRDRGPLDRQRAVFSIDLESEEALKVWGAEKIDQLAFDGIQASRTKIFYGGSATSQATLTATDKLSAPLISQIKAWSKTGGARSQTPLRPIMIKGKRYYVLLVHPDVLYDLKQDSTFAQARREAEIRSNENPIFSDSYAIWDGVVIHEHENITIGTDAGAGSNVPYAQGVFMGAQALVWAWGKRPQLIARDFDYGREHGYAWCMIARTAKPVFNSLDYGSVGVDIARTQISDA